MPPKSGGVFDMGQRQKRLYGKRMANCALGFWLFLLHKLGQNDNPLALNTALDMGRIVGDQ